MIWFCLWFFPAFFAVLWDKDAEERKLVRICRVEKKSLTRGDFLLAILVSIVAGPFIALPAFIVACGNEFERREWLNKPLIRPKSK